MLEFKRILTGSVMLAMAICSHAQTRPVVSSWTLGVGTSHMADTYLTPLKYNGWSSAINYERMQVSPWGKGNWVTRLDAGIELDRGQNPARNASMWNMRIVAGWGITHRYSLPWGFTVAIGPRIGIDGGCLYNARNSNNPASAKCAITLDATGFVSRSFTIARLPITLRYQPTLPVIGAFFSPSYDELYYEIYLGNHSGLVKPAWWGTRFRLDNLVTADLKFESTALRLGYRCDWMSSRASNITTRIISHQFLVGVTVDWVTARSTHKSQLPF